MGLVATLASLLGLEVGSLVDRLKTSAITYGLMAAFGLIAAAFLLIAAFIAIADALSPLFAALIIGGVFLLLTLAVYLGMLISEGRRKRQVVEKRRSSETGAFLTTAAMTALPVLVRSPLFMRLGLPAAAIGAFFLLRGREDD